MAASPQTKVADFCVLSVKSPSVVIEKMGPGRRKLVQIEMV
jgi:hypothetical protein